MRIRHIGLAAITLAVGLGLSGAQAASGSTKQISLDVGSFFAASQYNADGTVYGVRARSQTQLPSIQILGTNARPLNTPTPGDCSLGGFPGGWCNTAHNISKKAFGWDFHAKGQGVIVGIVDSGIDLNNQEFTGRILTGTCFSYSANPCTDPTNNVGGDIGVFPAQDTHGTHVAGIAAGKNVGLASKANILPVKVCATFADSCGPVDDGIVWASQHGANVINVSIGGPIISADDISSFQTAVANGSLLVVAGGNSGNKYPSGGFLAGAALADGVRGSMIVVGATGCNGPNPSVPKNCANGGFGGPASFTQVPGTRCEVHGGQRYCMKDFFVVAPGLDIWSSVGNGLKKKSMYGYLSGTSMATPYVTGVAALVKGQTPSLTSAQVADIIFQTADDIGAPGTDPVFGRGAVDVSKALSPIGDAQVRVATSSGSAAQSSGPRGALTSFATGPLAGAIQKSNLLKHAVVVDVYGRAFRADLTKDVYNKGFLADGYLASTQFTSYTPFVFSSASPLGGNFVASGYTVDTVTPRLLSGELLNEDRSRYNVRDLELTAPISNGVVLNAGFNLDMEGRFNDYDVNASPAYDGLFMSASAVNSPYLGFTDGGSFLGTTVALDNDLHLRFGASQLTPQRDLFEVPVFTKLAQIEGPGMLFDQRQASSTMAALSWDFAKWGGLGMTMSNTSEQNGLLGGFGSGALDLANAANTSALGLSARVGFGDGWVTTAAYSEGITQLDLRSTNSLVTSADTLHSRSYGLAVAKHGLFGQDDSLGLAVSRPIQVYEGSVNLAMADDIDKDHNLILGREHLSLSTQTPETDFELGYVTTFLNGALALQANAAYQTNLQGQSGANAVSVLSRAKINF